MNLRRLIPTRWGGCPRAWQLTRASLGGDENDDVVEHVRTCSRCSEEWAALARTGDAARLLPVPQLSEPERARLEARLLIEAAAISRPTWYRVDRVRSRYGATLILLSIGAAFAAVVTMGVLRLLEPRPTSASFAAVKAIGATSFTRLQPPPDELIRLDTGTVEVTVGRATDGRRLRIETDDAIIEASPGRFVAEASAHMLVAVRVFAGYAEVRANGERATLRVGDEWARSAGTPATRPPPIAPSPPLAAVPVHASPPPALPAARPVGATSRSSTFHAQKMPTIASLAPTPSVPPPFRREVSGTQRASFERGWNLLRSGDPAKAAEAFAEVERLSGSDAIAEDALFWQAVSLGKANRKTEAAMALHRFVTRFPNSERFGEASAMLGWMLLDEGDRDGAKQAFQRAIHDRVDRVRASAQSGLERIGGNAGAETQRE
jgi:TolA-binding protein